jgi:hypothetical protein
MPEPETVAAITAAAETIAPAADGLPGAADLDVPRHIVDMVEKSLPGMIDMVAALLNAYAGEVRAGASFVELTPEQRSAVLRNMSSDDSQDIRDAVDALIVFTFGGVFSEWSGYDRATRELRAPASWAATGFHGPVHGHPNYREDV